MRPDRVATSAYGPTEDCEEELREACKRRRIGLFIDSRERHFRRAYVFLKQRGSTLGVFHSCRDALRWLVPPGDRGEHAGCPR